MCRKAAKSSCWSFRLQGIQALKAAAESNQLEPRRVIPDILHALDQRIFQGKEDLVECLTIVTLQSDTDELKISNIRLLINEASRGNIVYKTQIFKSINELCENIQKASRASLVGKVIR